MKNNNFPPVSIIIPVYNEGKRLLGCLDSIKNQSYPQEKLEIIVVDDNSSDNTTAIAKKYNTRILTNGSRNIEKGKSIGVAEAKNEYLLLLDADNRLSHKDFLAKLVRAMEENQNAVGAEAIWFKYDKGHTIADRYCELFGINDPMAYYLNRRDRLMAIENNWNLQEKLLKKLKITIWLNLMKRIC